MESQKGAVGVGHMKCGERDPEVYTAGALQVVVSSEDIRVLGSVGWQE